MARIKCQVSKTHLKRFKKIQDDVTTVDAKYLVGKVSRSTYLRKRNTLKKQFESLKRSLKKC